MRIRAHKWNAEMLPFFFRYLWYDEEDEFKFIYCCSMWLYLPNPSSSPYSKRASKGNGDVGWSFSIALQCPIISWRSYEEESLSILSSIVLKVIFVPYWLLSQVLKRVYFGACLCAWRCIRQCLENWFLWWSWEHFQANLEDHQYHIKPQVRQKRTSSSRLDWVYKKSKLDLIRKDNFW